MRPTSGATAGCGGSGSRSLAFAAVFLAVFLPLLLFGEMRFIFLGIVVALAWMFLYMPFWRRRVRRAVAEAPRWELHPE